MRRVGLLPAYIESGYVIAVDATNWRVTVRSTAGGHRVYENCLVAFPYLHHAGGEGMGAMPEVGAAVWVCAPSEGDELPFVIGFRPMHSARDGSHAANRAPRIPGDQFMLTRDGNGFIAHRGGTTEEGATPIARRFYHPLGNRIHDIAENYRLDTFGGSDAWTVSREEEDPDGHKATLRTTRFKAYTDDKAHVVELEAGHVEATNDPVVRLRVYEDGDVDEDSLSESFSLSLFQDGSFEVSAEGGGTVVLPAGKTVTVRTTDGNEEGVVLGRTFLTQLSASLAELVAIGTAVGLPATQTTQLIANITTSLSADAHGGAPLLSSRFRTE